MPGTGHNLSTEFISILPYQAQTIARGMLALYPLERLIQLRLNGPDEALRAEFGDIDLPTWRRTFNAVLLTKLTALELYHPYSPQEHELILDIISLGLELGGKHPPLAVLEERTALRYPRFHTWLKTYRKLQQQAK